MGAPPIIPGGYVLLSRQIVKSSLWALRPEDFRVAIWFLATVNHEPRKWCDQQGNERVIQRGETVRSLVQIAAETKLSRKVVATSVRNLVRHGFVSVLEKRANAFCHYRIRKYEHYQDYKNYTGGGLSQTGQHPANDRPTPSQHPATNNEGVIKGNEGGTKDAPPVEPERPTGSGAVLAHLVNVAESVTLCSNRIETVERYLRALLARGIPAPKIEEALCRPDLRGHTITEIQDVLVPRDGSGGSGSSLDEIKRICDKLDAEGR